MFSFFVRFLKPRFVPQNDETTEENENEHIATTNTQNNENNLQRTNTEIEETAKTTKATRYKTRYRQKITHKYRKEKYTKKV